MSMEKSDILREENRIKSIIIGDMAVGKTNLINIAVGKPFNVNQASTLSQNFSQKVINHMGIKYTLDLWDTIGQENLRNMNKLFYKNSRIVIFVYDITNLKSFEALKEWVDEIDAQLGVKNVVMGVVGNKIDLFENEEVSDELGEKFAKSIGALFLQISAKQSEPKIFVDFLYDLLKKYLDTDLAKEDINRISLTAANTFKQKEKTKCCN